MSRVRDTVQKKGMLLEKCTVLSTNIKDFFFFFLI